MNNTDVEETLKGFVVNELLIGETTDPTYDDELLVAGIIDSLGVTRLIGFVGQEFGVDIPPQDVIIDNFSTISHLADHIRKRSDSDD